MSKHHTITKETSKEASDEERKNNWFSFIVGIVIAMVIIIVFAVLSLQFPMWFH